MRFLLFLIHLLFVSTFLASASFAQNLPASRILNGVAGNTTADSTAGILNGDSSAAPQISAGNLAKWEPLTGCYIGAFIEREPTLHGDIDLFEALTKKKHASYFTYIGYGRPFPSDWVESIKAKKASPHIAFEPNDGLLKVVDDEYLRNWARDAAKAQCPIFLRWASEMNGPWTKYSGNPALYRDKFALVSRVMKEEAPNVAMVWTPFSEPQSMIEAYYPGDEWVDWVGINIYSVYVNNGDPKQPAFQKDPVAPLRFLYDRYASRKPIHISEYAATIQCKGTGKDTVDFAIEKMTHFYTSLRRLFPRVKSVNWFCLDTIRAGLANNNYSLVDNSTILDTYNKLIADEHFLSFVEDNTGDSKFLAMAPATEQKRYLATLPKPPNAPTILPARSNSKAPITLAKVEDDVLAARGVVATAINEPWLRGVKPGDMVNGDLHLRAQMPMGVEPRFILWQIDGATAALTNAAPYRMSIERDILRLRYGPGRHVARILVVANNGRATEMLSPEVEFFIAE